MFPNSLVPLSAPLVGARFGEAVARFFKKYTTFSGRASRSEFWFACLAIVSVSVVLWAVAIVPLSVSAGTGADDAGALVGNLLTLPFFAWALITLIPMLAVTWRRLHDSNRSGASYFVVLIPFVGSLILLSLLASPSKPEGARFDAN